MDGWRQCNYTLKTILTFLSLSLQKNYRVSLTIINIIASVEYLRVPSEGLQNMQHQEQTRHHEILSFLECRSEMVRIFQMRKIRVRLQVRIMGGWPDESGDET